MKHFANNREMQNRQDLAQVLRELVFTLLSDSSGLWWPQQLTVPWKAEKGSTSFPRPPLRAALRGLLAVRMPFTPVGILVGWRTGLLVIHYQGFCSPLCCRCWCMKLEFDTWSYVSGTYIRLCLYRHHVCLDFHWSSCLISGALGAEPELGSAVSSLKEGSQEGSEGNRTRNGRSRSTVWFHGNPQGAQHVSGFNEEAVRQGGSLLCFQITDCPSGPWGTPAASPTSLRSKKHLHQARYRTTCPQFLGPNLAESFAVKTHPILSSYLWDF